MKDLIANLTASRKVLGALCVAGSFLLGYEASAEGDGLLRYAPHVLFFFGLYQLALGTLMEDILLLWRSRSAKPDSHAKSHPPGLPEGP